jgi:hypothetical protein
MFCGSSQGLGSGALYKLGSVRLRVFDDMGFIMPPVNLRYL